MKISKIDVVLLCFLYLSTIELLYHASFKLNLPPSLVYILSICLIGPILLANIKVVSYNSLISFSLFLFYSSFHFLNSYFNSENIGYFFVVFLSFNLVALIFTMSMSWDLKTLFLMIKKLYYATLIYLVAVDIISITIMSKSQHVILSNILPILFFSAVALAMEGGAIHWRPVKALLLYILWIIVSVTCFTSDMRFQMKAVMLFFFLSFLHGGYLLVTRFVFGGVTLKLSRRQIVLLAFVLLTCFLIVISYFIGYLSESPLSGRERSLGLRLLVAKEMLNDFWSGSLLNQVVGYGFGSSMKTYFFNLHGYKTLLRSHSGVLSLFYEHGLIASLLVVLLVPVLFGKELSIKKTTANKKINNKSRMIYLYLLLMLICSWIVLNLFYLISVPVPNYAHQSQMPMFIMLLIYFNRKSFENSLKA